MIASLWCTTGSVRRSLCFALAEFRVSIRIADLFLMASRVNTG